MVVLVVNVKMVLHFVPIAVMAAGYIPVMTVLITNAVEPLPGQPNVRADRIVIRVVPHVIKVSLNHRCV